MGSNQEKTGGRKSLDTLPLTTPCSLEVAGGADAGGGAGV